MTTRDEALAFIERMRPKKRPPKESKLDHMDHGMHFIIRYISEHDNRVSSGEIAKEMHVSTARIAAIANKLEEKGLMVRTPDTEDLRKTWFSLTDKGMEVHRQSEENFLNMIIYVMDHLEDGEMDEFIRLSEKMSALGEAYMKEHPLPKLLEDKHA